MIVTVRALRVARSGVSGLAADSCRHYSEHAIAPVIGVTAAIVGYADKMQALY